VSDLGELLELLQTAETRWRTVHATVRHRSDPELWAKAMEREMEAEGGSGGMVVMVASREGDDEADGFDPSSEQVSELWLERPNRWRDETTGTHRATSASNGEVTRTAHGGLVMEYDASDEAGYGSTSGWLFAPGMLAGAFEPVSIDEGEHLGRPVLRVQAKPASGHGHGQHLLGRGADKIELLVDRELGVVLRHEAHLDGRPMSTTEVLSVAFDEPIDPSTFELELEDGQVVRRPEEMHHDRDFGRELTVDEAVERAGFAVWVPSRLPEIEVTEPWDRWESPSVSHMSKGEWNDREWVVLQYHGGSVDVQIQESKAEQPLSPGKDFESIERGGRALYLDDPAARHASTAAHPAQVVLDLEGTRITIASQRVPGADLVEVALGLVRAPATPPSFDD